MNENNPSIQWLGIGPCPKWTIVPWVDYSTIGAIRGINVCLKSLFIHFNSRVSYIYNQFSYECSQRLWENYEIDLENPMLLRQLSSAEATGRQWCSWTSYHRIFVGIPRIWRIIQSYILHFPPNMTCKLWLLFNRVFKKISRETTLRRQNYTTSNMIEADD
jgi:hypothetical protein